jgi:hypothetical protein
MSLFLDFPARLLRVDTHRDLPLREWRFHIKGDPVLEMRRTTKRWNYKVPSYKRDGSGLAELHD